MGRFGGLVRAGLLIVAAVVLARQLRGMRPEDEPQARRNANPHPTAAADGGTESAPEPTQAELDVLLAAYMSVRQSIALLTAASAGSGSFFLGATAVVTAAALFAAQPDPYIIRIVPFVVWIGAIWGVFQVREVLREGLYASMLERRINHRFGDSQFSLLDESTLWSPLRSTTQVDTRITRYNPLGSVGRYTWLLVGGSAILYVVTLLVAYQKGQWEPNDMWLVLVMAFYVVLVIALVWFVVGWLPRDLRRKLESWQTYYDLPKVIPEQPSGTVRLLSVMRSKLSGRDRHGDRPH